MNQTASATTGIAGIDHRPVRSAEDNVYQKITWRVMPIVLIAYIFAFLDRINIGYAQLQMKQDLASSDAIYGLGAGIFFITYLVFEVPSNLLLEKIGARLTFLRIMVLWGLTSAATAFVTEAWHFYVKGATGSIQMGLGALTALVIVGGLTILIGLPKSAVRVGAAADTTAH